MPSSVADIPTTITAATASSSNATPMVNNVPRRANKSLGSPGGILCRVRIFALGSYTNSNNNNNNNNSSSRDDQTIELDLESYRTSSHDEDDAIIVGNNAQHSSLAETVVPTVSSDITDDKEQHVDETFPIEHESKAAAVPVTSTPTMAASTHKVAAVVAAAAAVATTTTKPLGMPTLAASNNKVAAMPSPKISCCSPNRSKPTLATFHNKNNHKNAVPLPIDDNTESAALRSILDNLSEEQIEGAALASYQYYQLQLQQQEQQSASQQSKARSHYALLMIRRHWIAEKGNVTKTLHKVQQTLLFRKNWKVNETRQTFSDNDDTPQAVRRRRQRNITTFLGQKTQSGGRLFVRGFDRQGHACIHYIFHRQVAAAASTIAASNNSSNSGSPSDAHHHFQQQQQQQQQSSQNSLGCMLAFLYILEKAIACTESFKNSSKLSTDGMITVSVDLKGFSKAHVPPTDALQQILIILRDHYPERLYRVHFFDAPLVFRYFWAALVKPRIDAATKEKFQFVTGRLARNRIIRPTNNQGFDVSQCMPYQHGQGRLVEPVDMKAFLHELPFEKAYDE